MSRRSSLRTTSACLLFYERGCQGKNFSFDWEVGVFGPDIQPLVGHVTKFVKRALDFGLSCTRAEPRAARGRLGIHRQLVTTSEGSCSGSSRNRVGVANHGSI